MVDDVSSGYERLGDCRGGRDGENERCERRCRRCGSVLKARMHRTFAALTRRRGALAGLDTRAMLWCVRDANANARWVVERPPHTCVRAHCRERGWLMTWHG